MKKSFAKLFTIVPFLITGLAAMEPAKTTVEVSNITFTVKNATIYPVDIFIPYTNAEYEQEGSQLNTEKETIKIAPNETKNITMNSKISFLCLNINFNLNKKFLNGLMKQSYFQDPITIQNDASCVITIHEKNGEFLNRTIEIQDINKIIVKFTNLQKRKLELINKGKAEMLQGKNQPNLSNEINEFIKLNKIFNS